MDLSPTSPSARVRQVGTARVLGLESRAAMAQAASEAIAGALRELLERQERVRMVFAAAPSQAEVLDGLARAEGIDWARVDAFHMDEYIGLPEKAEQRFAIWLERHIFSRVPLGTVHPILPNPDPESVCRAYAALLNQAPIDIVCLGIGANGHIAFNDPPVADFEDPLDVKVVELDAICRQQQVDDDCFATLADVPSHAITLTIPRLLRAERLFCAVPGRMKRDAVRDALTGPITTACPASILRTHPRCTIFLDKETDPDV